MTDPNPYPCLREATQTLSNIGFEVQRSRVRWIPASAEYHAYFLVASDTETWLVKNVNLNPWLAGFYQFHVTKDPDEYWRFEHGEN